jgi:uncharacterized membrane protein required for colicin V production
MHLSIVDAIILLFILLGGVVGFKEGVIKKLTTVIGLIVVIVLSFVLKNKLSVFFYENLPFFDFWGVFKGVQVLNILFYEILAFVLIASVLMMVYRVILMITGLLEKVLKATVILSIPSKILGFFVGLLDAYIWVYIILFILTLPIFNIRDIHESQVANYMLTKTPILAKYTDETVKIYDEVYNVIDNRKDKTNIELNEESLDVMLKYKFVTVESAEKLIKSNKISVSDDYSLEKFK